MQDNMPKKNDSWRAQLKKGTLELAVLGVLSAHRCYGLELLERLNLLDLQVSDGSIYPLLARLRTEGKVTAEWVDKGSGHAHKYYTLTPHGVQVLKDMIEDWREYTVAINRAIGERK